MSITKQAVMITEQVSYFSEQVRHGLWTRRRVFKKGACPLHDSTSKHDHRKQTRKSSHDSYEACSTYNGTIWCENPPLLTLPSTWNSAVELQKRLHVNRIILNTFISWHAVNLCTNDDLLSIFLNNWEKTKNTVSIGSQGFTKEWLSCIQKPVTYLLQIAWARFPVVVSAGAWKAWGRGVSVECRVSGGAPPGGQTAATPRQTWISDLTHRIYRNS